MVKEFNLSEKIVNVQKCFIRSGEPKHSTSQICLFCFADAKEFIKISNLRISNQLRIHWNWLKKKSPKEVALFIRAIINQKAGKKLAVSETKEKKDGK